MEEGGLIGQLGINWKLFLSQAVNFFILLLILRAFMYKPLLKVIKERNRRIQEGLKKAQEADVRLKEVDDIAKDRLQQAEQTSIHIIKTTEQKAKKIEQSLLLVAQAKQKELISQIELEHVRQQEEVRRNVLREAVGIVKKFIIKTVELKPEAIDDALIKKAVSQISKE